jgi:Rrf2 family iron-sulfur cluster assembly transcriptional regulator
MFSKACEYGIRAVLFIAKESLNDKRVSLNGIASAIETPVAFTAKILQKLARHEIITSMKGPNGGFSINRSKIDTIKLSQIVDAIDGDSIYRGCGLGLKACNEKKPCPVHFQFAKVRNELKHMLENTTVFEMTSGLETGLTFLKR